MSVDDPNYAPATGAAEAAGRGSHGQGGFSDGDCSLEFLLRGLTEPQQQAVSQTEGPLLVLAGPGSGKTRVITRRIAYLIGLGIPSWQVLAVTFTNKAAAEMRERVKALLGESPAVRGLTVTTFHALCARLLRRYADVAGIAGLTGTFVIYDTDDQTRLIKRSLETLNLSTSNWPARSVLSRISAAKNELLDAKAFEARAFDFNTRTIAKIYTEYQRGLRAANAVDFDDLLLLTAMMLKNKVEIRTECQRRWRYLMVDEYQDTNRAQFVIASLIAGATGEGTDAGAESDRETHAKHASTRANICVVGDPDQSIYGWRGADISNILDFEDQFPGAKVIALGENFRSTKHIILAADALIRHNAKRKHKDLFTSNPQGDKIECVMCRDEHHEARLVVDWIKRVRETGASGATNAGQELAWKDFAVFYRTNALSRVVEDVLRNEGVPYVIARGTAFYQREEIKNALAYLRVVANPLDEVSLERIINTPTRGLGDATLEKVRVFSAEQSLGLIDALRGSTQSLGLTPRTSANIQKFLSMLDSFAGVREEGLLHAPAADGSLAELVERVVRESGLEAMYQDQAKKSDADADHERLENLDELISSAREFEETFDPASDPALALDPSAPLDPRAASESEGATLWQLLRAYLERVSLVADGDAVDPSQGAVTLMTLHAAKGLEFTGVAMIGLEEGLLPHSRVNDNPGELEEERRLAFVGVTRAMKRLLVTAARYRTVRGITERTIQSRFLSEIPKDHATFSDQAGDVGEWDRAPIDDDDHLTRTGRSRAGGFALSRSSASAKDSRGVPINVGVTVRHPQFGLGRVEAITPGADARAQIRFQQVGIKTLVLQYARLSVESA